MQLPNLLTPKTYKPWSSTSNTSPFCAHLAFPSRQTLIPRMPVKHMLWYIPLGIKCWAGLPSSDHWPTFVRINLHLFQPNNASPRITGDFSQKRRLQSDKQMEVTHTYSLSQTHSTNTNNNHLKNICCMDMIQLCCTLNGFVITWQQLHIRTFSLNVGSCSVQVEISLIVLQTNYSGTSNACLENLCWSKGCWSETDS